MKTQAVNVVHHRKNITYMMLAIAALLAVPLVAMQFTDEVDWSIADFVAAGILLLGAGLAYEFGVRRIRTARSRLIAAIGLLAVLALVWAELAVGVFGTPLAGS